MGFVSPLAAQDTFLWDFNDGTPFDSNAGVGAFMSVTAGSQTITMTTVDVQAPVYVDNGNGLEWDGVTYALAATNILGSLNSLAVNNQGPNPFSNEFQDFNEGEFWKMEFDKNVEQPRSTFRRSTTTTPLRFSSKVTVRLRFSTPRRRHQAKPTPCRLGSA